MELKLSLSVYESKKKWRENKTFRGFPHLRGKSSSNRMEWGDDQTISRFEHVVDAKTIIQPNYQDWVEFLFPESTKLGYISSKILHLYVISSKKIDDIKLSLIILM
jgi:hypothetical protein